MIEPKAFHRRMEAMLDRTPAVGTARQFARQLAPRLLDDFGDPLDLVAVELYEEHDATVARTHRFGVELDDLSTLLRGGQDSPEPPWVGDVGKGAAALVRVGEGHDLVLALRLRDGAAASGSAESLLAAVSSLQYAMGQHLRRGELEGLMEQARAIQVSLLPEAPPVFGDFELAGVSVPARIVGGDLFDYLLVDAETLGLTVADASGHGLPAALQARDVATGLRMGVDGDLKITRTVEKLNRVIHRSGLVSRFASLVFGELELNGNFMYINAGHPPPLLLDGHGLHELTVGGMVLGPNPDATYKMGFAHVDRGAVLVLFSDGVIECGAEQGEPFGDERLAAWLRDWRLGPADAAVADLLARLRAHRGADVFDDDVTVVYVRRAAHEPR